MISSPKDRRYIIHAHAKFRNTWDIVIIMFSLWNCILVPLHIAFIPESLEETLTLTINGMIEVAFLIDIFLNFRTTIANDLTGEEILDTRVISHRYLRGRFIFDLLSTVPFDSIFTYVL